MNESEIVKACLQGNRDSQRQLYERFAPLMLGVCYRYASSREEAEDFLQEAFITVFKKLYQWKGEGALGAWIRRVVVNTSLNCIKARHRFAENIHIIPIDHIADNTILPDTANENDLMKLVHLLPVGCKTVFNLYAIEGYSHDEIGKILGIKAGTSRSQLTKARAMLMQKLQSELKNNKNTEHHG